MGLIAKFYNAVGLIEPVIINIKLLFQEVYLAKNVDWESTRQLKKDWRVIVRFVESLTGICISRYYFYDVEPRDYIVLYELHGFSDVSMKFYGCCIYLKCITKTTSFHLL